MVNKEGFFTNFYGIEMVLSSSNINLAVQVDELWKYRPAIGGFHPLTRFYTGRYASCAPLYQFNRDDQEIKKIQNTIFTGKQWLIDIPTIVKKFKDNILTIEQQLKDQQLSVERKQDLVDEKSFIEDRFKKIEKFKESQLLKIHDLQLRLDGLLVKKEERFYIQFKKTDFKRIFRTLDQKIESFETNLVLLHSEQIQKQIVTMPLKPRSYFERIFRKKQPVPQAKPPKTNPLTERKIKQLESDKNVFESIRKRVMNLWLQIDDLSGSLKLTLSQEKKNVLLKHLVLPKELQDINLSDVHEYMYKSSIDRMINESDPESIRKAGINYLRYGTGNSHYDSLGKQAGTYTQKGIDLLQKYVQLCSSSSE